jgi:hypothetical protein
MNKERFSEDWVSFTRFNCKKGFIDRWIGDCISDPNKSKPSLINGNMITTYYRLNGIGEWKNRNEFKDNFFRIILDFGDDYSSDRIWDICLLKNNKK